MSLEEVTGIASNNDHPVTKSDRNTADQRRRDNRKKNLMANVGIEPKTFALLARRSNQLS
jgi:hypothetical protein